MAERTFFMFSASRSYSSSTSCSSGESSGWAPSRPPVGVVERSIVINVICCRYLSAGRRTLKQEVA